MRVFSTFDNQANTKNISDRPKKSKTNKIKRVKKQIPARENLSASEIRERLNRGLNKNKNTSGPKAFVTHEEMREKTEEAIGKAKELGAINNNDPGSDLTKSKLKASLVQGSFAFSDKERQVLSEILGK